VDGDGGDVGVRGGGDRRAAMGALAAVAEGRIIEYCKFLE